MAKDNSGIKNFMEVNKKTGSEEMGYGVGLEQFEVSKDEEFLTACYEEVVCSTATVYQESSQRVPTQVMIGRDAALPLTVECNRVDLDDGYAPLGSMAFSPPLPKPLLQHIPASIEPTGPWHQASAPGGYGAGQHYGYYSPSPVIHGRNDYELNGSRTPMETCFEICSKLGIGARPRSTPTTFVPQGGCIATYARVNQKVEESGVQGTTHISGTNWAIPGTDVIGNVPPYDAGFGPSTHQPGIGYGNCIRIPIRAEFVPNNQKLGYGNCVQIRTEFVPNNQKLGYGNGVPIRTEFVPNNQKLGYGNGVPIRTEFVPNNQKLGYGNFAPTSCSIGSNYQQQQVGVGHGSYTYNASRSGASTTQTQLRYGGFPGSGPQFSASNSQLGYRNLGLSSNGIGFGTNAQQMGYGNSESDGYGSTNSFHKGEDPQIGGTSASDKQCGYYDYEPTENHVTNEIGSSTKELQAPNADVNCTSQSLAARPPAPPIIELFTDSKTYKSSRQYQAGGGTRAQPVSNVSSAQATGRKSTMFYQLPENEAERKYFCVFCHSNKASPEVYLSHPIRVNDRVVCPTLRCLVCKICRKTGDEAHTIKYCPENTKGFFASKTHSKKKQGIHGAEGKFMLVDNKMVFVRTGSETHEPGRTQVCFFGAGDESLMGTLNMDAENDATRGGGNNVSSGTSSDDTSASLFTRPRPSTS